MDRTKGELEDAILELSGEIKASNSEIASLKQFRGEQEQHFLKGQKDDADAKALIVKAQESLLKFYKDNKISAGFVQDKVQKPEFAKEYGGRQTESKGIIAILSMLAEDLTKEMAEA